MIGLTGGGTPASGLGYWSNGSHSHVQIDRGDINHGIDPWPIWSAAGSRNLAADYGGFVSSKATAQDEQDLNMVQHHMASGGIVMRRSRIEISEAEPEAVIPLSRLGDLLSKLPATGGTAASQLASTSGTKKIEIGNLIGNLTLHVGSGGKMTDQEQDELMSQLIDILTEAARQLVGTL
jgi:hypothetical protein